MAIKAARLEIATLFILTAYFMFTATNVNPTLGQIFALFSLGSAVFLLLDPSRSIPLEKANDSRLGALTQGIIAYVVLILASTYLLVPGINKILGLLGATTPVLADVPIFNFLSFAVAIPIAETYFFFIVGFDLLASVFNVRLDRSNIRSLGVWALILAISAVFMFFHLTAKGIGNVEVLSVVFLMAIISMVLVVWNKSGLAAVAFHVVANMSAILLPRFT